MYSIFFCLGLIFIGIVAGFASGLLGVGGGFIIVPLQYFLLNSSGINSDLAMIVSIATSLAIIIPTALSGAYRHQKLNKDIIRPGIILGISGIIGSFIGGQIAIFIPVNILQIIFAIVLIGVAINMVVDAFKSNKDNSVNDDNQNSLNDNCDNLIENNNSKLNFNLTTAILMGSLVGVLSGLLGVGGGVFMIPILTILFGFKLKKAIGTSSVFISLTAIGGFLSYSISSTVINPIPYSIGYISLINWFLIILFSVPMASIGAKYVYKIPDKTLKLVFSVLILFMAIKLLGISPI